MAADFVGHVADLLTLKANWSDTLTVKQWEMMINNDVLMFSATNEDTPYEQLLYYWILLLPYSQTPLNGHPLNTDTSLLRTVCFVPGESPYIFSKFNPLNMDTFYGPHRVRTCCINGDWL